MVIIILLCLIISENWGLLTQVILKMFEYHVAFAHKELATIIPSYTWYTYA